MNRTLLFFILLFLFLTVNGQSQSVSQPNYEPIPDAEHDYLITITTRLGKIKLILFDETPEHKKNFVRLVKLGVYDGTDFYRVIDHFMIQGGNPRFKKNPNPKDLEYLKAGGMMPEIRKNIKHLYGSIASPSSEPGVKSNSAQFYIVENRNGAPHLDGKYTVFGRVMSGFETISKIAEVETKERDRPVVDVWMNIKVELVSRAEMAKYYEIEY